MGSIFSTMNQAGLLILILGLWVCARAEVSEIQNDGNLEDLLEQQNLDGLGSTFRKIIATNGKGCKKMMNMLCTAVFKPVCASDGKTYSNLCEFKKAKCKNTALKLVSKGPCDSKPDPFDMIDEDGDGSISLKEWLHKTKRASQNYGVNLSEDELKEMFSSMACGSDGKISSKTFHAVINDEIANAPCAIERGPFWKWVKIAIKVVVVIIEICCLTGVCDC